MRSIFFALVVATAVAASADYMGRLGFSLAGEYAMPFGDLRDAAKASPGGSIHVLYGLTETITSDMAFSYFAMNASDEVEGAASDPKTALWTLDLSLRYTFDPDAYVFFPYTSVGAGYDAVKWTAVDTSGVIAEYSYRKFGVSGVVGLAVRFAPTVFLDLAGRFVAVFTDVSTTTFLAPRVGVTVFLGSD